MSKIAIIGDTHFGYKNDATLFRDYFNAFFQKILLPYIDTNGITEVVHLGDLMDRRKYVNFETLKNVRENFVEPLRDRNVTVHLVLGNHDVYFKNTNEVNSPKELFSQYSNLWIYEHPTDVRIGGVDDVIVGMVPWISPEGQQEFADYLKTTQASILMGHFEISGFEIVRGVKADEGLDPTEFKNFDKVYSGHFHQRGDNGQIFYLGTQYDMTFADVGEQKGFHVLDTVTRKLEFIPNPSKLFYKLIYDDTVSTVIPDFTPYHNTYVKLIIKNKKSPKTYDKYISKLYEATPADVDIIDEYELIDMPTENIDITQDTLSIIYGEIDANTDVTNPSKLKKIMNDLFLESFEVD